MNWKKIQNASLLLAFVRIPDGDFLQVSQARRRKKSIGGRGELRGAVARGTRVMGGGVSFSEDRMAKETHLALGWPRKTATEEARGGGKESSSLCC